MQSALKEDLIKKIVSTDDYNLLQLLHTDFDYFKTKITEHMQSAGGMAMKLLPMIKSGGASIIAFFVSLSLIPVVLFYFLKDWNNILVHVEEIIPLGVRPRVMSLARDVDAVLSEFLRGQVAVMITMSIFYAIGLWLTGLDYGFSIGLVAGILVFIPYLGMMVGMALADVQYLLGCHAMAPECFWVDAALRQGITNAYCRRPDRQ